MNALLFFLAICIMTVMGSVGAMFLKRAMECVGKIDILGLLKIKDLYIGTGFYVLGILINFVLLQFYDYTLVYPLTSLTYVWTLFVSAKILKEKISKRKIIGVVYIIAGAFLIGFCG